jgi:hypothetical protein
MTPGAIKLIVLIAPRLWFGRSCDGRTAAPEIARRLQVELDAPFNEELVWLALNQLEKLDLLEHSIPVPAQFMHLSRRRMVRHLGLAAAVAVPLVLSIQAPTAAQAGTCLPRLSPCIGNPKPCCPPNVCHIPSNKCQ